MSKRVLHKLQRVGKGGSLIGVYKFRTMYAYSEYLQPYIYEHNHLQQGGKFADDYRVTPWGRWMRKYWIDELPRYVEACLKHPVLTDIKYFFGTIRNIVFRGKRSS